MNELENVEVENEMETELTAGSEEINIDLPIGATTGSPEDAQTASNVIADIPSEIYGAFIKILQFLSQGMASNDIFFIKDGKLNTKKTVGFIYSDMTDLFNENSIEIIDPNTAVKLMTLLRGGEKVVFLKDQEQYILTTLDNNEPIRSIVLPIPEVQPQDIATKPELGELVKSISIPIDRIEDAINASKVVDSSYFVVSLDNDFDLVSIETQNGKYKDIFKKDVEDPKKLKLFELMLISKPEEFTLNIYKNGEDIWFQMISDLGLVKIEYLEKVDEFNDFDAFTL